MVSLHYLRRISLLASRLDERMTEFSGDLNEQDYIEIHGSDKDSLNEMGIHINGNENCVFIIHRSKVHYERLVVHNSGQENLIFLGNQVSTSRNNIMVRFLGSNGLLLFPKLTVGINLPEILFRSDEQCLFWGIGSTSVWSKIEIEGNGKMVAVGDDCMLSTGVWIRNHDMHVLFDVETGETINSSPTDILIERHVWLGFDSFVLGAPRIGFGSAIGARTLVKETIPPKSLVVGAPARIVRSGVSWGRESQKVPVGLKEKFLNLEKLN